ncbi:MAG: T9SS type A sorting domain-containing protein [Ignavibacteriae bacterium]|nr:T9SS type A sorting domain-containing protein [Ignavibacteriota bacterium]
MKFQPLILILLFTGSAYCQLQTEWVSRYAGNTFNHFASDMAIDDEGNSYITGALVLDSSNSDFITLKYNKSGSLIWARTYNGPQSGKDIPSAIKIDRSGNVIVTGTSRDTSSPLKTYSATVKYGPNGDTLWVSRFLYQDSLSYFVEKLEIDGNDNIYTMGNVALSGQVDDIVLTKYLPDGTIPWQNQYDATSIDLEIDRDNNPAIFGSAGFGGVLIKYNPSGDSIWGIIATPQAIKMIKFDNSNNAFLVGVKSTPQTSADYYTAKVDTLGNILWERTYHNNSTNNIDSPRDFIIDTSNNIIVTGISAKAGELGWDYLTIKYDPFGDSLWVKRFNPVIRSNDEPVSIASDNNGNVFVSGKSDKFTLWNKISTVVYTPGGNELYYMDYDTNAPFLNHVPVRNFCDNDGNLYVAGSAQNPNGNWDMVIIKYSAVTNISHTQNEVPEKYELSQNYPNPFNPSTNIQFDLPKEGLVSLKIYDMLGREVAALVNEFRNAGRYIIGFNGSRLASGVYYYKLKAGNFEQTKRMVLIK